MLLLEQAPQKTFPQLRQWCLRLVKVKAVRHRMQTSESVHSGGWGLMLAYGCTFCWSKRTDCAAIEHVARDVLLWGEVEAFALQTVVDVVNVAQVATALCSDSPGLDELEHLVFDVVVGSDVGRGLEQRRQVVHELARRDLLDEVGAAILDACVGEVEGGELNVGVLVADALLEGAHGVFRLHRLGADYIGDVEVEGHVLSVWRQSGGDAAGGEDSEMRTSSRWWRARSARRARCWSRTQTSPPWWAAEMDRGGRGRGRCRQTRMRVRKRTGGVEAGQQGGAGSMAVQGAPVGASDFGLGCWVAGVRARGRERCEGEPWLWLGSSRTLAWPMTTRREPHTPRTSPRRMRPTATTTTTTAATTTATTTTTTIAAAHALAAHQTPIPLYRRTAAPAVFVLSLLCCPPLSPRRL
jgi:hypothetical protein